MSLFTHIVLCTLRVLFVFSFAAGVGAIAYLGSVYGSFLVSVACAIMVGVSIFTFWVEFIYSPRK